MATSDYSRGKTGRFPTDAEIEDRWPADR